MLLQRSGPIRAARPTQRATRRVVVCQAQKPDDVGPMKAVALPLASMVAAALIAGAVMPEDALAASSRSGGRVGGSSGFSSRKSAAPSRSIQTQAAPSVNSTTIVVAPAAPVYSPFGFSPFGGFGFGFGVPIFMPGSVFSGLLGLMAITLLFSVVLNVIRGIAAASSKQAKKDDDSWGDL
ncbi:hypothetical protein Vretimale_4768 [Volvox reticuliferus]|uniref:Uncharacterized protein n=1 Tax=Volvox reticuliferus TaxID=1737510 RepID=A0A8J4C2D4_9CHLO|nr:hypothetical protein Vretifemale_3374 [Volvox reticuliferus]GIL99650.1 hypothetical protein Vretimale_4768 [Volvox reticuliferus]